MAITDQTVLNEIQYHVIEPPNNGASMASDIWTIPELIVWLNDRQSLFISQTKLMVQRSTLATTLQVTRYNLNNISTSLVDIIRAAWTDVNGTSTELARIDKFQADLGNPDWVTTFGTPDSFSILTEPTQTIDLIPAPSAAGTLDLIYTYLGTTLSNTGVAFTVPDDFVPFIKWGVLADMLKKAGQSQDMQRYNYCEMRFQEGILVAKALLGGSNA